MTYGETSSAGKGNWLLVSALSTLVVGLCVVAEASLWSTPFTIACAFSLISLLLLLTRRPLFSIAVAGGFLTILAAASKAKSLMMAMTLHAYDFIYFAHSPTELAFMAQHYPSEITTAIISLSLLLVLALVLWFWDPLRVRRMMGLRLLVIFLVASGGMYRLLGAPDISYYFRGQYLLSSFFASIPETAGVMRGGGFFSAQASTTIGDVIRPGLACPKSKSYPSIVFYLNESAFPPNYFANLEHDPKLMEHFRSSDGVVHKLGVETFGGGTWLSEFNALTGLSTYPLGSVRTYLGRLLEGRIKHSLPSYLKACGYDTLALYPARGDFVNSRPLYTSLGFDRFLDSKDMKASSWQERDSYYFGHAFDELKAHFAKSDRPLLIFIITSATHFPYDTRLSPNDPTEAGGPKNSADFNEYLRRLALGQQDYNVFKAEIAKEFPKRKFVLAHFGDHQPFISGSLQNLVPDSEIATGAPDRNRLSFLYETYYKIEGVNMKINPLPDYPILDVPYLSTVLLQAAGVPLDDAFQARARLMRKCEGHLKGCPEAEAVNRLYKGLIEAGLLIDR